MRAQEDYASQRRAEGGMEKGNFLDKGMKLLKKRQKHIKVANRLDYGWATVEHYDSHLLADISDNEKHLEKAEREAGRMASKHR